MLINKVDQTHCRYYDDQKRMRATGYDFEVLQSAASHLPNLRGVRITCNYGEHLNKFVHPPPAWGDAFCNMAEVMASPNDFINGRHRNFTREITACLAAFKLASRPLSWLDCANFEIDALRYDENEASDGDESEDESEGDYIGITVRPSRFKNFIRDPTKDLGPPLVCATFKNLTAARLNFPAIGGPESEFLQEKLGTALRGAHGLDTLCIGEDFTDHTYCSLYQFSFAALLGSSTWPHLHTLSLTSFTIRQDDLSRFFERHPSLHAFKLYNAYADDSDWATILQVPSLAARWRQLHSLTLSGSWGGRNWNKLFSFDLRGRFHFVDSDGDSMEFEDMLDLQDMFGKWAWRATGERNLRQLLERYYRCEAGEAPFPLRTVQEVLTQVAGEREKEVSLAALFAPAEELLFLPAEAAKLLVATEKLVGEKYRLRDLYAEYPRDGKKIKE